MKLEDLLVREGTVDPVQAKELSRRARFDRRPLVALLVEGGVVAEDALADLLAREVGTVVVDLDQATLESESVRLLPQEIAAQHLVIPVARDPMDGSLRVAFANPLSEGTVAVVRQTTRTEVRPLVATVSGIRTAIDREYRRDDTSVIRNPGEELPPEATTRMHRGSTHPTVVPPREADTATHVAHRLERDATMEQKHEALLLALIESGYLTRSDYLDALSRLLSPQGDRGKF